MYRTLIIILFLFFGKTVSATNHNTGYSFTQLSIQQGLSQPTVQSILLDERGTLWIGTKNGLNIYTQEGLKTYLHHSENPYSGSVVILGGLTFVNFPLCIHLC